MTAQPTDAYAAWQRAVASVLAKAGRADAAESPNPEHLLERHTYDGITIGPLYTSADELPELPLPGRAPYTRGASADGGWHVCARYGDGADASMANRQILDDLANGVTSIWLTIGDGITATDTATALDGVLLDLAPLRLDAGAGFVVAASALLDHAAAATVEDRAAVRLSLGADPWTVRIRTGSPVDGATLDDAVRLAQSASDRPERIRTFTVDGTVFHDAGASDADEVGASIAAGGAYLRAMLDAGLDPATALGAIEFRYAVTDDQFAGIAKLRAARTAWARVAEVAGVDDAGSAIHAVTSAAMMTQRDPWVNLLRTTLAAFAAGVGGAGEVTVRPLDDALASSAPGVSERFAARIARNTQLLLLEESNVGRVADPAGGSWYAERRTQELAEHAWQLFQELERAGGFGAALESGQLADRIAATREARRQDIAHRRTGVTGVSEFPNLHEPTAEPAPPPQEGLLPTIRYAQPYEAMRDRADRHLAETGARPTVSLVALGSIAEHNQRVTYARNLLASAGIDAVSAEPIETVHDGAKALSANDLSIAIICGTDARYQQGGAEVVSTLRAAGAERVYAVGAEPPDDATGGRPDAYLAPGIDAVEAMNDLLDRLGVSAG